MSIEQSISEKLQTQFLPQYLKIENESHMHSSGRGTESHFKIILVSSHFEGQRAIIRHRAIYTCLADELACGIHALALHTYTPSEWTNSQNLVPTSPNCLGVGK